MNNRTILPLLFLVATLGLTTSCSSLYSLGKKKQQTRVALASDQQRKFDYYFLRACELRDQGDYAAAQELYQHCLVINPSSAVVLSELSSFYFYLGEKQKGEELLLKAIELAPTNYWYYHTLAAYYVSSNQLDKAIATNELMLTHFSTKREAILNDLVSLYGKAGNNEKVLTTFSRLEKVAGQSEQLSMNKMQVYYAMGKKDKAIEELKQLTQEYPTDERYWAFLGNLYLSVGENKQAKAMIDKAMELEPRMPAAELMLLHYYENTNQSSRKDSMRMAVIGNEGVTSDDKVNLLREAIVLSEQTDKDSTKVVSLFQQSVELNKKDANMLMLYIQYLLSKKMNEQSIPVVQQLIAVDPENMPARLQLLSNALTQKDYKTVVGVCQDALLYLPGKFQFYYYQGVGYYLLKEYDQALAILEKATKVEFGKDTSSDALADLYSLLGDLYHEKELFNKMCTAYDTALKYDPDKIMTLNNYAYYLSLQRKNLDKAEEMSYKTIQAEPKNNTYLDTYAWILFEKKRWAEAKVYIDQAMTNGGDKEGSIVEHCGDIYFMNNLKKEALDYWKKALQLGGGSSQLKQKVNKKTYIFP